MGESDLDTTIGNGDNDSMIANDNHDSWARLLSLNPAFPHVEVQKDECTFGRKDKLDVVYTDKRISSLHCRIFRKRVDHEVDFRIYLEDLSSNGTFVSKVRVGKNNVVTLVDKNEISLSSTTDESDPTRIVYTFQDLEKMRREAEQEKLLKQQQEEEHTQLVDEVQMLDVPVSPIKQDTSPDLKKNNSKGDITDNQQDATVPTPLKSDPTQPLLKQDSNLKSSSSTGSTKSLRKSRSNNSNLTSTTTTTTSTNTTPTKSSDQNDDLKRKRDDGDDIDTPNTSTTTTTTTTTDNVNNNNNTSTLIKKPKIEHDTMEENLICGICQEIIHKCLTLIPCMHNFCMCCYGDWRANSTDCPQCRAKVLSGQKNHAINNLIESYLSKNPEKRRDPDDLIDMDKRCKITDDMLKLGSLNKSKKKYGDEDDYDEDEDYDDEDYDEEEEEAYHNNWNKCPSCTNPMADGYQCPPANPPHSNCSGCGRKFPKRTPPIHNDHCEICNRLYCLTCSTNPLLHFGRLDQQQVQDIPRTAYSGNQYEIKVLTDYMSQSHKIVQQVYNEVISGIDQGNILVDTVILTPTPFGIPANQPPPPQQAIKGDKVACQNCTRNIFSQGLFTYRKNIPKDQLPLYAQNRDNCYYGKNCRTQFNKMDHAKKLNHVCEQSKFN